MMEHQVFHRVDQLFLPDTFLSCEERAPLDQGTSKSKPMNNVFVCLQAPSRKYSAHSSHVTNVSFLFNDSHLISTGGKDTSIMQWRLLKKPSPSLTDSIICNPPARIADPIITMSPSPSTTPIQEPDTPLTANGTQETLIEISPPTKLIPPNSDLTPPHSESTPPPSESTMSLKDSLEPSDDTATPSDEGLPPLTPPS